FEMKRMWEIEVEPRLRELSPTRIVSRTLKVLGMGESAVEQVVVDLMSGSNPTLAPYAKQDGIHLRITAKAGTEEAARAMIEGLEEQVRARLNTAVYGADDESPSGAVLDLLERAGARLAVLEVGEGAIGAVSPQLATSQLVVGSTSARDLAHAAQLLAAHHGAQGDFDLPGLALLAAKNSADVVLAVAGRLADSPERTGSVEAECEVVVVWTGGPHKEPVRASYRWRTARSEVSRLFGLMSLNQLRLELLGQES
ncbi:MAG TPA: hypothetical protein VEY08_17330, partial [Chloroflexia bacterium]|nr:hypothetical protein [Chloroflexia bacterium]